MFSRVTGFDIDMTLLRKVKLQFHVISQVSLHAKSGCNYLTCIFILLIEVDDAACITILTMNTMSVG